MIDRLRRFAHPKHALWQPKRRPAYIHRFTALVPLVPPILRMSTTTKISPLRHLVNILSDAVARIDEKYASANLDFPTLDKPPNEKDTAHLLLSDPDVVPLSSIIVAAANQLIVSARPPIQAVIDMAQSVSSSPFPSHIRWP